MRKFVMAGAILAAALISVSTVGCSKEKPGEKIRQDMAEHSNVTPNATATKAPEVTLTEDELAEQERQKFLERCKSDSGKLDTEADYLSHAQYVITHDVKFSVVSQTRQSYDCEDSYGNKYDVCNTELILCEFPSEEDILLDNKFGLDIVDIMSEISVSTCNGHSGIWLAEAIEDIFIERFRDGITNMALIRSTLHGDPKDGDILVSIKCGNKQNYLTTGRKRLGAVKSMPGIEYVLATDVNGTSYLACGAYSHTVDKTGAADVIYRMCDLTCYYGEGTARTTGCKFCLVAPNGAVYEGTVVDEPKGVAKSRMGEFYVEFKVSPPMVMVDPTKMYEPEYSEKSKESKFNTNIIIGYRQIGQDTVIPTEEYDELVAYYNAQLACAAEFENGFAHCGIKVIAE